MDVGDETLHVDKTVEPGKKVLIFKVCLLLLFSVYITSLFDLVFECL